MGRWIGPIAFKPISGWCDYMLIDPNGLTAFVDAKTSDDKNFCYSLINRDQLTFLQSVGDRCPAGYAVYFRGSVQRVVFFSWDILLAVQPKGSLKLEDGLDLGPIYDFSPKKIFLARRPTL